MALNSVDPVRPLQLVALRPGRRRFALVEGAENLDRLVLGVPGDGSVGGDETVEITVTGELDFGSAGRLEAALAPLVRQADQVRVRLDRVTFFDAAGARALVRAARVCRSRSARFVVVAPSVPVQRVLGITGLHRILDIEE